MNRADARTFSIDDLWTPLILVNDYVGIRNQLPTFYAVIVVRGDASGVLQKYGARLKPVAWQARMQHNDSGRLSRFQPNHKAAAPDSPLKAEVISQEAIPLITAYRFN